MGYKPEQFVGEIDEHLYCPECHEVFKDPVHTENGRTLCNDCIKQWLRNIMDVVPNYAVRGILDNLITYCPYSENNVQGKFNNVGVDRNCDWTGKLKELTEHTETCPFQQVQCPYANCTRMIQRREMEEHKRTCTFKIMECEECKLSLVQHEVEKHKENDCPETLIPCPNRCTNIQRLVVMIKRKDSDVHLRNLCKMSLIDCPFKEQGCSIQTARRDKDKHLKENMSEHMLLLAKRNSSLSKECWSLAKQCASLTKRNAELEEGFFDVMEDLNSYISNIQDYPSVARKHPYGSWFKSTTFWLCGYRWYLLIYPNGNTDAEEFLSLYLRMDDAVVSNRLFKKKMVPSAEICVSYRLSVIGQAPGTEDITFGATFTFRKKATSGCLKFMKAAQALSLAYCNSANGGLVIKCTIKSEKTTG